MVVKTYDDWLALSLDAKQDMLSKWDAYEHEMFWVPMIAASRLASISTVPVTDIYVGIYHGGAYVLHLTVSDDDIASCPPPLSQKHEGFEVIWLRRRGYSRPVADQLYGDWQSKGEIGEFMISIRHGEKSPEISVRRNDSSVKLQILSPSFDGDRIEFYTKSEGEVAIFHRLTTPSGSNCCNHHMSFGQIAKLNDPA